jgi:hypothetical protein
MAVALQNPDSERYARCIRASKSVRWDIDADVLRGRSFDVAHNYLPNGLAMLEAFPGLDDREKRLVSQIQGRTYANMFGFVERFINAKVLELSQDHWLGDQVALEALVRFSDEELKHQELFRRIETMLREQMPQGYTFVGEPNTVASVVLGKSSWAVMALTLHIELFTQIHYRHSIDPDDALSPLFKDVFLYHWKEESQHAILDELEWKRLDARMSAGERDQAVDEFIELVGAVDALLQAQAMEDSRYFRQSCGRPLSDAESETVARGFLQAYRWQYILSGAQHPHFVRVLTSLVTQEQAERIMTALEPLRRS